MEQLTKIETPLEINNRLFNKFYSAVFNNIHRERRNIEKIIYYYENRDTALAYGKEYRTKKLAEKREAEKEYVEKYNIIKEETRMKIRASKAFKEAEAKRIREYRKNNKEKVAARNKAYNEKMKLDPNSKYKTEEYKAQERERMKKYREKKKNLDIK